MNNLLNFVTRFKIFLNYIVMTKLTRHDYSIISAQHYCKIYRQHLLLLKLQL